MSNAIETRGLTKYYGPRCVVNTLELNVPVGQKIKLVVENRDATPEEFESKDLSREKVIPGKTSATIFIGPLKAGSYKFFGEYNEKTAKGVIVAK